MYVTAIIAAGGRGERLGAGQPKQFLSIAGQTILERSVRAFLTHAAVDDLVVALPADLAGAPPAYLTGTAKPLRVVAGGARRQDSVANALQGRPGDAPTSIVMHDAARPFASADLIARTIAAAAESGAALAAVAARDTVKQVDWIRSVRRGRSTARDDLPRADAAGVPARRAATRSRSRVGAMRPTKRRWPSAPAITVRIVEGEAANIKITTPEDLAMAEAIAATGGRSPARTRPRVGTGYDLHRLVAGRPLILGGVTIPFDAGALGHSDADVVCHAVTDAILGAAGARRHRPPFSRHRSAVEGRVEPRPAAARGGARARRRASRSATSTSTVIARAAEDSRRTSTRCARRSPRALGIDVERVSIKGKTNEGVDARRPRRGDRRPRGRAVH